jgi:folylpolyglutamate synthase/dihydropteroate synthase
MRLCTFLIETLMAGSQKAGIFKAGSPAFSVPQPSDGEASLRERAVAEGVELTFVEPSTLHARGITKLGLAGEYQWTNAALAVALSETFLASRSGGAEAAATTTVDERTRHGLATAHWPGRAHTLGVRVQEEGSASVDRADAGGASVDRADASGALVQLWLDGAHTEASIQEAGKWYWDTSLPPSQTVLMFACGMEKDCVQLMLPLVCKEWDQVIICPLSNSSPTTKSVPSAAECINRYAERKTIAGDSDAVVRLGSSAVSEAECPTPAEDRATLSRVQRHVWEFVARSPRFADDRARFGASGRPTGALAVDSLGQAFAAARKTALSKRIPTRVFVTGSLYLVGEVLRHVGWHA